MAKPDRIPLFPLNVVLLPNTPLPLHIFEPRYKKMIRRCLDEKIEFGMILVESQKLATIGCTAGIVELLKEYPDGKMDILTLGRSVFRLAQFVDEEEYYEGNVEYLEDTADGLEPKQEGRLFDLFMQCHVLLYNDTWNDVSRSEPESLSYRMAGRLPMENEDKQALLETRAESKRREFLADWLSQLLPVLVSRQRARRSANGNGHRPN